MVICHDLLKSQLDINAVDLLAIVYASYPFYYLLFPDTLQLNKFSEIQDWAFRSKAEILSEMRQLPNISASFLFPSGLCLSCQKRNRWRKVEQCLFHVTYPLLLVFRKTTVLLWPCLFGELLNTHPDGTKGLHKSQRLSPSTAEEP